MTRFFGLIMVQKWKKRLFSVCWLAQVWFAVSCRRYYQHDHRTTRIVVLATLQFKYWRRRPSLVVAARWPKPSLRCKEKTKPIASKRNNCVLVSYVTHWGDCTAHFYFSVFTSKAFLLRAIFHSLLAKLYNPCRSMPHQMTVLLPSVMLWRGKMTNALVATAT